MSKKVERFACKDDDDYIDHLVSKKREIYKEKNKKLDECKAKEKSLENDIDVLISLSKPILDRLSELQDEIGNFYNYKNETDSSLSEKEKDKKFNELCIEQFNKQVEFAKLDKKTKIITEEKNKTNTEFYEIIEDYNGKIIDVDIQIKEVVTEQTSEE